MKFSSVLPIFASILIVGCAGSSPLSPDSASVSSARAMVSPGAAAQAFFPPINPAGISCPSDAPQIRVSSLGSRMDIDFSEVTGAIKYEIEITDYWGAKVTLEVPAPAYRAEWYGPVGLYSVRVRTVNCGGFGNWSVPFIHALDAETLPPQPPVPGPPCTTECEPSPSPQCIDDCEPLPPPTECVQACEPPPPPPSKCAHVCV